MDNEAAAQMRLRMHREHLEAVKWRLRARARLLAEDNQLERYVEKSAAGGESDGRAPSVGSSEENFASMVVPIEKADCPQQSYEVKAEHKKTFCRATDGTLSGWICLILSEREGWREVPKEHWFTSERDGPEMYKPVGGQACEYCDRSVFSYLDNRFEGSECLYSKVRLAHLLKSSNISVRYPETFIVRGGEWEEGWEPSAEEGNRSGIIFLKADDKDFGTGITVCASMEDCLREANASSEYVVQRHIDSPHLHEGKFKYSVRGYLLFFTAPGERKISSWMYRGGYLVISKREWDRDTTDHSVQVTTNRDPSVKFRAWDLYKDVFPRLKRAVTEVAKEAVSRLGCPHKRAHEIFGFDFILDSKRDPILLEVNSGPSTKEGDIPMIKGMLDIVLFDTPENQRNGDWFLIDGPTPAVNGIRNEIAVV